MEICADCGKPIQMGEGSYYRRDPASDIGQTFHSTCGDPLGIKAKDAEIERLRSILVCVANDSRSWQLHAPTQELLREFVIEHLDGLPIKTKAEGLAARTGRASPSR